MIEDNRGSHFNLMQVVVAEENSAQETILKLRDKDGKIVERGRTECDSFGSNPLDPNFKGKVGSFVKDSKTEKVGILREYYTGSGTWMVEFGDAKVEIPIGDLMIAQVTFA